MRTIRKLPSDVISKIAAGEVIERPAYVVKELIENAIDAQADSIVVDIEDFGLTLIRVSDNGSGMSREDVEICFLPHTTSKLESIDQLFAVVSFGFRGEALSSIAQVSNLKIVTRRKQDVGGTIVSISNGKLSEISSVGAPVGTTIHVSDLFSSIPARKKFLKSQKTELRILIEIVSYFALSHPRVHFLLNHNKKTIFDFPARENINDRIQYLLGGVADELIQVSFTDDYISISGFIGKPQVSSRNVKQYLFVNNRMVSDQMIRLSVKEAFGSLIPSAFSPVFMLHLSLPPEMVDVNVHPRKEQVSFINQKSIFDSVKQAVLESLGEHNLTFRLAKFRQDNSAKLGETDSLSATTLRSEGILSSTKSLGLVSQNNRVFQIHETYICVETPDGIVFIDQHAAHERVLFSDLLHTFEKRKNEGKTYRLSKPQALTLSFSDLQLFEEHSDTFIKLGFIVDHLQKTGIIIRGIPDVFRGRKINRIIEDMLSELRLGKSTESVDFRTKKMLMFLSCRAAVKAGDGLSEKQMKELIKKLSSCSENTTCPHGRPTSFVVGKDEMDVWFKRR